MAESLAEGAGENDPVKELDWLLNHLRIYIARVGNFCVQLNESRGAFSSSSVAACIEVAFRLIDEWSQNVTQMQRVTEWSSFQHQWSLVTPSASNEFFDQTLQLLDHVIGAFDRKRDSE